MGFRNSWVAARMPLSTLLDRLGHDDTPMCARILGFVDGEPRWSIDYDGSDGVGTPAFSGEVPAEAAGIWAHCQARQRDVEGVDYHYELVTELGKALTGFRHDEDPEGRLVQVDG